MLNIIRIAKVVALLAFVLPWVAVSCQGVDLATASGIELIQGTMTTNPDASKQLGAQFGGGMGGVSVEDNSAPQTADLGMNYFALATAVVIALGLALTFIGAAKAAARNAIVTSLLAAALSYGAIWQFKEAVKAQSMQEQGASQSDNPFGGDMGGMASMGQDMINNMLQERFGYWIVLGALIVAAGAGGLGLASAGAQTRPEGTA
jgi:hypothetical protein